MAGHDPAIDAHQEWLGFVRPTGLVVSAPALVRAGAILNQHDRAGQEILRGHAVEREWAEGPEHVLPDFHDFARDVLGWSFSPKGYAGTNEEPIPGELEVHLPDFGETLVPDLAVKERSPEDDEVPWQLLVRILDEKVDFDTKEQVAGSTLDASPHGRMERLLRQTGVRAGLLFNGRAVRLVSAPRGESSGWLDFRVEEMVQTAGRPICAAMRLLLSESRLLSLPKEQRLSALLEDSRQFQNEVSEKLAEQVLHALYELLRGMQMAHDQSKGKLLNEVLQDDPDEVYRALLTVLLRIVFLLYAEERDMLPAGDVYQQFYSIAGLHERLREDAAQYPDTMDQRYGGWAQLLGTFRMIYDGAELGSATIPTRHGVLFDPDRFPFLEGRPSVGTRQVGTRIEPPLVPDGTVYRALDKLLVLDGERISYRALDVEQIGSVYETMMGFRLETASGRSLAIRSKSRYGASATINLEALLNVKPSKRRKWLQDRADRKVSASVNRDLKAAESVNDVHAALRSVADLAATPDLVSPGAMVLQPSEERRRSGSHYTPRALTEPIVRKTLAPLLRDLEPAGGGSPSPEEILDLKICDPAMGSGAFLVETCRQLGDALLDAWKAGDGVPTLPADEDEVVFARRRVAQRCIYGVDRNPVAVDLAKVSLWLATLARDHAFTFLDHALRHGDSLVGLSLSQIQRFHWLSDSAEHQTGFEAMQVREHLDRALELRNEIRNAGEDVADWELRALWDEADMQLDRVRLVGDLLIKAFLDGSTKSQREQNRAEYAQAVATGEMRSYRGTLDQKRETDPYFAPFHWSIEFLEVFDRSRSGFDALVGNPPFMGGRKISTAFGGEYLDFIQHRTPGAKNTCDLVAYFFRRAFGLLRDGGTMGFVATNTIAQGDTRAGGLLKILKSGGTIYAATRRLRWPGNASVVVSVVHVLKGPYEGANSLDGDPVPRISAFLFHAGGDEDPKALIPTPFSFSQGSKIYGQGFLFDDSDPKANDSEVLTQLREDHPEMMGRVLPYIGGAEVNSDPSHRPYRKVIFLSDIQSEAELKEWQPLEQIVRENVKPYRDSLGPNKVNLPLKRRWWAYQAHRPDFYEEISEFEKILVCCRVTRHLSFAFLPTGMIFSEALILFATESWAALGVLQSRIHEIWARFFSSTLGDALRYTPSDCFETFPFPKAWQRKVPLREAAEAYYEYRAEAMSKNEQGLTDTYNRFHHPNERDPEIKKLRELHAEMDRAVLEAYGWGDIPTECEFLLDYEIDEENWNPRKKKPWRYRWPDDVHDEVLARLLELNEQRAEAERMGASAEPAEADTASSTSASSQNHDLFDE